MKGRCMPSLFLVIMFGIGKKNSEKRLIKRQRYDNNSIEYCSYRALHSPQSP